MWATAEESREQIVGLFHGARSRADATIDALALDAAGQPPWWPADRGEITQHRFLVHMIAETHRHAGHADIMREFIDAAVGLHRRDDNVAPGDRAWWRATATGLSGQPATPIRVRCRHEPGVVHDRHRLQGCRARAVVQAQDLNGLAATTASALLDRAGIV